jgi:hypothetical protein
MMHCLFKRLLIARGADRNALTDEGEKPIDLVDPEDKVRGQKWRLFLRQKWRLFF